MFNPRKLSIFNQFLAVTMLLVFGVLITTSISHAGTYTSSGSGGPCIVEPIVDFSIETGMYDVEILDMPFNTREVERCHARGSAPGNSRTSTNNGNGMAPQFHIAYRYHGATTWIDAGDAYVGRIVTGLQPDMAYDFAITDLSNGQTTVINAIYNALTERDPMSDPNPPFPEFTE